MLSKISKLKNVKPLTSEQKSTIVGGIEKSKIKGPASMAG